MFDVDGMTISMSIGDTGAVRIRAVGYEFGPDDIALFTVKTGNGSVMIQREYHMDANGAFTVCFHNSDTEGYAAGAYSWDVRYIINPYRTGEGNPVEDGDQVITPYEPQMLILKPTVGTV